MANGNMNGLNRLKRMEIEFKGNSYHFTVNPQNYEIKQQSRVNVTHTKLGAFIDKFGGGIKEITLVGTTGFKAQTKDANHGYEKMLELSNIIESEFNDVADGQVVKDFMTFYNHTDGQGYVVIPIRFTISRSVNEPLLYRYDLFMYAIRPAGQPAPQQTIQKIGNPLGTPTTSSTTVKDRDVVEKKDEKTNFTETNKQKQNTVDKSSPQYLKSDSTGALVNGLSPVAQAAADKMIAKGTLPKTPARNTSFASGGGTR